MAQDLFLAFGERKVINNISFRIAQGERIGLIGPNGSGKSTLLRILADELSVESGSIQYSRGCQIGYLPQDILELPPNTLLKSVLESVPGKKELDDNLAEIVTRLNQTDEETEQLAMAQELAEIQARNDHFDFFYSEHEALKILFGLGFTEADLTRAISEFSGGWKMRIALASILFRKPELILLDEPTNHLDVPSVVWFDEFLRQYTGAMVLVSHDRYFLNRQIERLMSFEREGLRFYTGSYDTYCVQRKEEEELLDARAKNIMKERKELERFVDRFKAKATKARQAQSRVKMIARLEKQTPELISPQRKLRFTFPETTRTGYEVVKIKALQKNFGTIKVFDNLNKIIYRGDRIAVVGKNGIGKTTLLKIIAHEIEPSRGMIDIGHNVELRYYAQHHTEILNKKNSILSEVLQDSLNATQTYVRSVLGAFLFPGDDVEKPIGILSGGEKARVALAKLLVKPGNLLLMDEPTNHLDVDSAESLAKALKSFSGTLVFVSHNRSFVDHLATRVWDLTPHGLVDYSGNLERYLEHQALTEMSSYEEKQQVPAEPYKSPGSPGTRSKNKAKTAPAITQSTAKSDLRPQNGQKQSRQQWQKDKERKREKDRLHRNLENAQKKALKLEQDIEKLEEKLQHQEIELANPIMYQNNEGFNQLVNDYENTRLKIEYLYEQLDSQLKRVDKLNKNGNTPQESQ
ncbi:ABC-F family ATP-binding cassette domain-containing protein [candidate division CSSED10-310 bacterium]|uniref:ABC-F family ATP-binding cassette domain-containing protein n=1 Tax=candidate division CSSED10-310 bacterium TaxID=2855610 RepID=A0ABV6YV63_UNCC1